MPNTVNIYVNKTDLQLNNVDNTSDLNKPISNATQTALNGKENVANKSTNTSLGTSDTLYPSQKAVKTYVDSAVSGAAVPTLAQVTAAGSGTSTPISVLNATFNSNITPSQITTFRGTKGVVNDAEGEVWINTNGNFTGKFKTTNLTHNITLEMPVKNTGTYTIATTDLIGAANGLAELDGTGKVPTSQLPSFVDDVVEYANLAAFPVTGESGKIYVALNTNITYRWAGSTYVEISPSLALGETIDSAYRGDRGKIAYDHSQLTSGNPHNVTKTDVGLSNVPNLDTTNPVNIVQTSSYRFVTDSEKSTWNGKEDAITAGTTAQYYRGDKTFQTLDKTAVGLSNVDNTSDANKPISTATQTALNDKSDKNITLDRKTASYTLVATDNGKMIEMNVAGANTLTINASIFSAGNQILISQYGAGQTTITAGAGVTLRSSGGKLKTSAQYSLVTIIAISSTEFYVAGDLTA